MSASGPRVSRDIPILFSAPMIRALIREVEQPGTGKTQTRRLLTPQPDTSKISPPFHPESRNGGRWVFMACDDRLGYSYATGDFKVRYRVGDRLYVRETWRAEARYDDMKPTLIPPGSLMSYDADYDQEPNDGCRGKTRVCLHMPRWASRLTLTVTDVRVQRLQDISEADAVAEGAREYPCEGPHRGPDATYWTMAEPDSPLPVKRLDPVRAFRAFFEELHGEEIWQANPWVCAVSFSVERRNIDAKVAA